MPFEISWSQALLGGLLGLIASFFISTKAIPSLILRLIIYIVAGIAGSTLAQKYLPASEGFLQFLFNLLGTSVVLLVVAAFFRVLRGK